MKIKKNFKSILGVVLCLMLSLGTVTTSAITSNEGTVLPDPSKKGSITIHKYAMDQLPNPGTPASGLEDENQVPEGAEPLEGVTFTIERVVEDKDGTLIFDNIKYSIDKLFEAQEITTGNDGATKGIAKISELEQGVYLVTEKENAGVLEKGEPFIVSIPMAHPTNQNSWLYDIHVYPKNVVAGAPNIDKDVTLEGNKHETSNIGENVTWIIKPSIPEGIKDAKKYDIIDKLDTRLNYTGNLEVYYMNGEEKIVIDSKYYTADEPTVVDNVDPQNGGGTIVVSFNKEGREFLAGLEGITGIRISFTTMINTSAEEATAIPNDVTLDYTNSFGTNTEYEPTDKPEVHTGGVILEKVDASGNNIKLQGAKFKIYPTLDDAKAGRNAIMNPENKTEDWEVTTDENGIAKFKGLSYGNTADGVVNGETKYYIVETQAPSYDSDGDGINDKQYNLLRSPLEVKVNATSHLEENKVVVKNSKFILPVTGGAGTIIFTVGGLSIMAGAIFLYMKTMRKTSK